jgi:hypothetical protein
MKHFQKILLFLLFCLYLGLQFVFAEEPNSIMQPQLNIQNKDFIEKIILAVTGAIFGGLIGFFSNYLLAKRKEKNESKELSYEIETKKVITKGESPIKDRIGILYNDNPVNNLSFVSLRVRNSGEIVVKDEQLRFEFPSNTIILDSYLEPPPEPELAVSEIIESQKARSSFERIFKVGHLVKDKSVNFNFVINGADPNLKIHDYNEGGDVKFNEASVNRAKNDAEILREFLIINFIIILFYPLLTARLFNLLFFIPIGDLIWAAVLIIINIRFIKPVARILVRYFLSEKQQNSNDIRFHGDENIAILDVKSGTVNITKPTSTKELPNL